jgi:hypothetical protein
MIVVLNASNTMKGTPTMRTLLIALCALTCLSLLSLSCKKESSTGPAPSLENCGGGQGYKVSFTKQVDHYEAGYGVAGSDVITVTCIVGPSGATVSNATNGTYYCSGTYKLTTFQTATIELNWGGSTSYTLRESHNITSPGQGTFVVKCTKSSGGSGNLYLTMNSGSSWMFNTVLVDTP